MPPAGSLPSILSVSAVLISLLSLLVSFLGYRRNGPLPRARVRWRDSPVVASDWSKRTLSIDVRNRGLTSLEVTELAVVFYNRAMETRWIDSPEMPYTLAAQHSAQWRLPLPEIADWYNRSLRDRHQLEWRRALKSRRMVIFVRLRSGREIRLVARRLHDWQLPK
jgi:hypothetical protein